jgi:iron(II)-dependent oxidoreductase
MSAATATGPLDRQALLERFTRTRARTRALFDLLDDGAYYERPISLRNPVVFYEGHLPAFAVNTLIKKGLGRPGVDEHLERIFSRGIDPGTEATAVARGDPVWPSRDEVRAYVEVADRLVADALGNAQLDCEHSPLLQGAQAVWTILEHEEMHQETLAYMWHQLPYALKRKPAHYVTAPPSVLGPPVQRPVRVPGGRCTVGTNRETFGFGWDNELPARQVHVDAFAIDAHNVSNAEYLEFVEAGGYSNADWWRLQDWAWLQEEAVTHPEFWERHDDDWHWHGMFETVALPVDWPVYVTWAEASAYARWRGRRLPTEAEYIRATYGTPNGRERRFPWGETLGGAARGNFGFERWDPVGAGRHPDGVSAFGVHDLVGNGWEWTGDVFGPFEGFEALPAYPEYSADFFDGDHFVMKGASPVTPVGLVRSGFRNWFRPRYPYIYATFRCVEVA